MSIAESMLGRGKSETLVIGLSELRVVLDAELFDGAYRRVLGRNVIGKPGFLRSRDVDLIFVIQLAKDREILWLLLLLFLVVKKKKKKNGVFFRGGSRRIEMARESFSALISCRNI